MPIVEKPNYIEITFVLTPLLPAREILLYELGELGFESFTNETTGLKAYIPESDFIEDSINALQGLSLPDLHATFDVKVIKQQNWNAKWEAEFDPILIEDQCAIVAPFHDLNETFKHTVVINPQMSFGTGHHQTTYMLSNELLSRDLSGKSVLDMGCGTGVLAILAEQLGADKVEAIDIDEFAYENTIENIELNSCSKIDVHKGGAELLTSQSFHLILANINRNILVRDMEQYVNVLAQGGEIWFSGFFESDFQVINERATDLGLVFEFKRNKEQWAMLAYSKQGE